MSRFKIDFIKFILLILLLLTAAACSSMIKDNAPTLESLQSRKSMEIKPQEMPVATKKEALKSYQEFAKNTKDQELRAAAMERLADISLETKQDEKFRTIERREKQIEAAPISTQDPVHDSGGIDDYIQVAEQYEQLLKRYPNSRDNDKIMYQLARAYDLSGDTDKSLTVLSSLIKKFPDTRYIEEVQFRRGEILFSLKRYDESQRAYEVILKNTDSQFYERSVYKHGWTLFKQNKTEAAMVSFYRLLDIYFRPGKLYENFSSSEKEIVGDTLRVISLAHSFSEGAKSIQKFSKKQGERHYEHLIYTTLGDQYLEQERVEDAALTFSTYAESYPNSREAPLFLIKVIDIYRKAGFAKKLSTAKADFVTRYGVNRPFWARHDRVIFDQVAPQLKQNLGELAKHYHSVAQKSKGVADYRLAAHWYQDYVDSFPAEPETAKMNFLLAEIYSETQDYKKAAIEYEKTAYNYPLHEKSAEAGYAAVLIHQKIASKLTGNEKIAKQAQATESALKFAEKFPADKRAPAVLVKAAEEFIELKRLGEASETARKVAENPNLNDNKIKAAAWAIVAKAEFDLGNHLAAEQASVARLMMSTSSDEERKVHIERLAAAIYKQGETARQANNHEEAAKHFLRVGQVAPTATIRATAEYDAAASLAVVNNWKAVIDVLNRFIRIFPNHQFTQGATEKLAVAYENENNWSAAAGIYDTILAGEQDPEKQRNLLWQMAEYYEKSNDAAKTLQTYERYADKYPVPVDQAVEASQKIADIYKKQGNTRKRVDWLEHIILADDRAAAASTDRMKFLAASAALELAEPTYEAYRSAHLVQPLKPNLQKKKNLMQKSIEAYTKAADYGVAEVTTASTYRIAEIYSDFSRGLFASERPKGLSSTELEQYDLLLEEQAFPFEEKAIQIHETNAGRVKAGVYDEWVKKSFIALRKLRPIRYAKLERSELFDSAFE